MALMTAHSPHTRTRSTSVEDPLAGPRGIAIGLLASLVLWTGGIVAGLLTLRWL